MTQSLLDARKELFYRRVVWVISILIPAVVAFLILMPQTGKLGDFDFSAFPAVNATLNSLTALSLIMALVAIKAGNVPIHRTWMTFAFTLSSCFLILYVLYHFQEPPTRYGDSNHDGVVSAVEVEAAGPLRMVYFCLLVSHIVLAAVVLPFILLSFYFALSNQISKHRSLVRYTWPVWFFVAVSGVLVYFMIRPFYAH